MDPYPPHPPHLLDDALDGLNLGLGARGDGRADLHGLARMLHLQLGGGRAPHTRRLGLKGRGIGQIGAHRVKYFSFFLSWHCEGRIQGAKRQGSEAKNRYVWFVCE